MEGLVSCSIILGHVKVRMCVAIERRASQKSGIGLDRV